MTRYLPLSIVVLALAACNAVEPPAHEFLVSAGDSTFWVRRDDGPGSMIRSSPILLARLDGRFHELYVTDDDRSFFEAVLIGQRVYRRDLANGDSLLIFEDSVIPALARSWTQAHPGSRPLDPQEESSDDPEMYATAELEIIDLHGPYLSYEYHHDIESRAGDEAHSTRWGVLDIRQGRPVTLADLYGDAQASRLVRDGRASFAAMVDSMLAAGGSDRRMLDALAALSFDPRSFTITQLGAESGVAFLVTGQEPQAGGLTLELDPFPAGSPPWWIELREELPEPTDDPAIDRWRRSTYDVLARYDEAADTVQMALRAGERGWRVASVPAPVQRIEWLDAPPIDSATRQALDRAFDEAVLYDPDARIASRGSRSPMLFRFAMRPAGPDLRSLPARAAAARSQLASTPNRHR